MSAPPYMKLFWGDYHKATRHLTRDQHGAYFLLIGEAWRLGGALPDDDAKLAAWALCTPDEWATTKPIVMDFFTLRRGKWWHDRVREELASYEATSRKRKEAGKIGGKASVRKQSGNQEANALLLPTKPEPEPEPEIEEAKAPSILPPKAGERVKRATRIPVDWTLSPACRAYAESEGLTPQEISRAAADFHDYWSARSGREATKLDWPATWRQWVRKVADRKRPASPTGGAKASGYRPQPASMAGILAERRRQAQGADDVSEDGWLLRAG